MVERLSTSPESAALERGGILTSDDVIPILEDCLVKLDGEALEWTSPESVHGAVGS